MAQRKTRSNRNRSRRNRSHRSRRNRSLMGGFVAPVDDSSMLQGQKDSLAQGSQYLNIHKGQYGGNAEYPNSVTNSTLPQDLVAASRTGPLDTAMSQIRGMQDGGRRRRSSRSSRNRKHGGRRSSRKHRGGSHAGLMGSPLDANSMLLSPGMEKQAALNYEWSMAKDPNAFAPNP